MISATELVQIAAPARSTGFVAFSGSLGSARNPTRLVMGSSRAELQVIFSWPHRELVLRFLREISPQEHFSTP